MLPSGSGSDVSWKEQILTKSFVGDAVAQATPDQSDPRTDYIDSIDVIFGMHTEYMPIIRFFGCTEDANDKFSAFQVVYFIKDVLDTRFGPERLWKGVYREGTS